MGGEARLAGGTFLLVSLLLSGWAAGASAHDRCLEGASAESDRVEIAFARFRIEKTCDCAGTRRRGLYMSCVRASLKDAIDRGFLRVECFGPARRMERRSTCGFGPGRPRVVCLERAGSGPGSLACRIRPASRCSDRGALERTICSPPDWPYTHCVDAADSNGDLRIAAPQDEGRCAVSERVFQTPSAAQPAETPGTPGVVVTNPALIESFGSDLDLNVGVYTRWRLNRLLARPDAVLIAVAGFGGGANNFRPLAQNLISRMYRDHGLVLEVWGFHRRSNLLEDRAGAQIAAALGDPEIALDWYFGGELGLGLHPALAAGPGRRANFYDASGDVPFLANFTPHVFSQDIDAVVAQARTLVRNDNVFLAGHSAGTGFAARYAATDFDASGTGPPDPGYARLRGLVLLEGGGGSTGGAPLSDDSLDRIIAGFDGGRFGAVRDAAARCVDGTTPCTIATEAADCAAQTPAVCTPAEPAYVSFLPGVGPEILATAEVVGIQAWSDPDAGQGLIQVDQGAAGNSAVAVVPGLALLSVLPPSTAHGLFGGFLDDESLGAMFSLAVATSLGAPGPVVGGLQTWQDVGEGPLPPSVLPDNGPPPAALAPDSRWGREVEVVDVERLTRAFASGGSNAADWYFATSGLSALSAPGRCDADTCVAGDVGAACADDGDCAQSISLDSSALSLDPPAGRGRRDIANLTQAGAIDIPVLCIGGSNGLAPVPVRFAPFAESIGTCTAPSCDGSTPRLVAADTPSEAFPTFGGVAGGFEVHVSEGLAHADVTFADDVPEADFYAPLADFLARNTE